MSGNLKFEDSRLWQKYLAPGPSEDPHSTARSRMRISFERTRALVAPLVAKIAQELPNLTIHDVTHLDSLWHVADTLLGDQFPLNPAEVYVLGMAFLLHDAATTSYAFAGGIDAIKSSTQWKDYVAQQGIAEEELIPGSRVFQRVLFETLRALHASHALKLPTQRWKDINGEDRYLIEDIELRNHYGSTIGMVAASHGEDSGVVERRWGHVPPMSAHSSLGLNSAANWTVDRLKVALALRCIDAAHIDSMRAPDMQACLSAPTGESRRHWLFQNRLGAVAMNEKAELYWSSSAFGKDDADAWWRCYETCSMVDREIAVSNRILRDNGRETFTAVGVMGAGDTVIFQRNVPVEGWEPVDFNFKVSQVGAVIEKFGGERLYGTKPHWALRELIQNASDAVRARRVHCDKETHGQIAVRLRKENDDWWLDVQDDGIGMTRYVMTDVLLDFGRSLWRDGALRDEWSGLSSKGFSSMGQFGIGFFSVFMLGDEVKVTSWAFGRAEDQQLTLHLRNRVVERPLIVMTAPSERMRDFGTVVSIRLKNGFEPLLRCHPRVGKVDDVGKVLAELVAWIAPMLDIDVRCSVVGAGTISAITANDWKALDSTSFLRRLYPGLSDHIIDNLTKSLENIAESDGTVVGRAILAPNYRFDPDLRGALVHRGLHAGTCTGITGALVSSNNSDLARQASAPVTSASAMTRWAASQLLKQSRRELMPMSEKVISLGVTSHDIVVGTMGGRPVTAGQVVDKLERSKKVILLVDWPECPDHISEADFDDLELKGGIVDLTYCSPLRRFDFDLRDWLDEVLPEHDETPRTVIGLIEHIASTRNLRFEVNDEDCFIIGKVGEEEIDWFCYVIYLV